MTASPALGGENLLWASLAVVHKDVWTNTASPRNEPASGCDGWLSLRLFLVQFFERAPR